MLAPAKLLHTHATCGSVATPASQLQPRFGGVFFGSEINGEVPAVAELPYDGQHDAKRVMVEMSADGKSGKLFIVT
jgi:hypothetical protein